MKNTGIFIVLFILSTPIFAQELFVNTEPASNMATGAIGFRLTNTLLPSVQKTALRISPEVMFGLSRQLMFHMNVYGSNAYQPGFKFEGLSIYGKLRVLALDQAQAHFRVAIYGRASLSNNPINFHEINLQGENSGALGGIVITQLIHKLALSASTDLSYARNNIGHPFPPGRHHDQLGYTLSAGYLLLPRTYTDYKQTNVNIYVELLGKNGSEGEENFIDIAPAVQFIINSKMRIDLAYQHQLSGNMSRLSTQSYLLRLEYNIFNAF